MMSSYYLALRDRERFCWTQHVCAPCLDGPDTAWFDAGLPVVGYFHDREPALVGAEWIGRWLDHWRAVGARTLLDFRELASIVSRRRHFEERDGWLRLGMMSEGAPPELVRPLTIAVRAPGRQLPLRLSVLLDDGDLPLKVHPLGNGTGHTILPRSSTMAERTSKSMPLSAEVELPDGD